MILKASSNPDASRCKKQSCIGKESSLSLLRSVTRIFEKEGNGYESRSCNIKQDVTVLDQLQCLVGSPVR